MAPLKVSHRYFHKEAIFPNCARKELHKIPQLCNLFEKELCKSSTFFFLFHFKHPKGTDLHTSMRSENVEWDSHPPATEWWFKNIKILVIKGSRVRPKDAGQLMCWAHRQIKHLSRSFTLSSLLRDFSFSQSCASFDFAEGIWWSSLFRQQSPFINHLPADKFWI